MNIKSYKEYMTAEMLMGPNSARILEELLVRNIYFPPMSLMYCKKAGVFSKRRSPRYIVPSISKRKSFTFFIKSDLSKVAHPHHY